jgi:hypothetical protein
MNLSLTSLLPTLFWVAIAIGGIAVGLGRQAPRPLPIQQSATPRYQGVNGRVFARQQFQPRFIDRQTGRMFQVEFPVEDVLDYAACSPWRDEHGQFQVVSRWMKRTKDGLLPQEFGLARFTLPEGRLTDRVELDVVPVGDPCWVPGSASRILFVGGDGVPYHYSFDATSDGAAGEDPSQAKPRRVSWRTAMPGIGVVAFRDIIWPSEPALGGRLIASIWYLDRFQGQTRFVGSQLWWIQLSGDATAITAAGRLTPADSDVPTEAIDEEERLPQVTRTAEGGLALAYLHRSAGQASWELRVAPIAIDPDTGSPLVRRQEYRSLTEGCVATAPVFSLDGRWLYAVVDSDLRCTWVTPRRFPVAADFGRTLSGLLAPDGERPPRHARIDPAFFLPSRLARGELERHARR